MPLNLGILWFFGFLPFVIIFCDLQWSASSGRAGLPWGEAVGVAALWVAGMLFFDRWIDFESSRAKRLSVERER
ncbi:hypothetical protein [Corallococcus praedator]|uniref:hypothetical protein n=1 Tax=Corallococcus praedator TaxID=2316724 RepID=UPI0011C45463|nr:hypothetical protein [Corallococcus praedator]